MSDKTPIANIFLKNKAEEINNPLSNWSIGYLSEVMDEYAQAKHKEDIKQAYLDGYEIGAIPDGFVNDESAEQYYKENYEEMDNI